MSNDSKCQFQCQRCGFLIENNCLHILAQPLFGFYISVNGYLELLEAKGLIVLEISKKNVKLVSFTLLL